MPCEVGASVGLPPPQGYGARWGVDRPGTRWVANQGTDCWATSSWFRRAASSSSAMFHHGPELSRVQAVSQSPAPQVRRATSSAPLGINTFIEGGQPVSGPWKVAGLIPGSDAGRRAAPRLVMRDRRLSEVNGLRGRWLPPADRLSVRSPPVVVQRAAGRNGGDPPPRLPADRACPRLAPAGALGVRLEDDQQGDDLPARGGGIVRGHRCRWSPPQQVTRALISGARMPTPHRHPSGACPATPSGGGRAQVRGHVSGLPPLPRRSTPPYGAILGRSSFNRWRPKTPTPARWAGALRGCPSPWTRITAQSAPDVAPGDPALSRTTYLAGWRIGGVPSSPLLGRVQQVGQATLAIGVLERVLAS